MLCPRQTELMPPQGAFTEVKPVIPWHSSPAAASSAGDAESVAKITSVIFIQSGLRDISKDILESSSFCSLPSFLYAEIIWNHQNNTGNLNIFLE